MEQDQVGLDELPLRDFVAALALIGAAGLYAPSTEGVVADAFAIADEFMKRRGQ